MISEELCKLWDADHFSQSGHTPEANNSINRYGKGPQYNQILTPPLASARVHSQTFATVHSQTLEATVQYNKCIKPTPCPSPSLCQFHLLNTPSRPPYPGHQVVKYTTAHGSPHTSKCAFWSSGCSILVSVSSNSPKIHWRPPSDA